MRTALRLALLALLIGLVGLATAPAHARTAPAPSADVPQGCTDPHSTLPHGALWFYCVPADWNHDVIVFAHGYVAFNQPLDFYNLSFDGIELSEAVQSF